MKTLIVLLFCIVCIQALKVRLDVAASGAGGAGCTTIGLNVPTNPLHFSCPTLGDALTLVDATPANEYFVVLNPGTYTTASNTLVMGQRKITFQGRNARTGANPTIFNNMRIVDSTASGYFAFNNIRMTLAGIGSLITFSNTNARAKVFITNCQITVDNYIVVIQFGLLQTVVISHSTITATHIANIQGNINIQVSFTKNTINGLTGFGAVANLGQISLHNGDINGKFAFRQNTVTTVGAQGNEQRFIYFTPQNGNADLFVSSNTITINAVASGDPFALLQPNSNGNTANSIAIDNNAISVDNTADLISINPGGNKQLKFVATLNSIDYNGAAKSASCDAVFNYNMASSGTLQFFNNLNRFLNRNGCQASSFQIIVSAKVNGAKVCGAADFNTYFTNQNSFSCTVGENANKDNVQIKIRSTSSGGNSQVQQNGAAGGITLTDVEYVTNEANAANGVVVDNPDYTTATLTTVDVRTAFQSSVCTPTTNTNILMARAVDDVATYNYIITNVNSRGNDIQDPTNEAITLVTNNIFSDAGYSISVNGANTVFTENVFVTNSASDTYYYITNDVTGGYDVARVVVTIASDIQVIGNEVIIPRGDTTPSLDDYTDFGVAHTTGIASKLLRYFRIENVGFKSVTINTVTSTNSRFTVSYHPVTISPAGSNILDAGDSIIMEITYTPPAPVPATNDRSTITISGTGFNSYSFVVEADAVFDEPSLVVLGNFIEILDGDSTPEDRDFTDFGSAFKQRKFILVNRGTAPLSLELLSSSSPAFTISSAGISTFIPLDPDEQREITINLVDTTPGDKLSVISIKTKNSATAFRFRVQGKVNTVAPADQPELHVTGNSIRILSGDTTPSIEDFTNFGFIGANFAVGASIAGKRDFIIQNFGSANLFIDDAKITSSNPLFTINRNNPIPNGAGIIAPEPAADKNTFTITFRGAGAYGLQKSTISFAHAKQGVAFEQTFTFVVQALAVLPGLAAMDVRSSGDIFISNGDITPAVADGTFFGNELVAASTISKTFKICNTGQQDLNIVNVRLNDASTANSFSITTAPSATIAVDACSNLVLAVTRATAGFKTAVVQIFAERSNFAKTNIIYTFQIAAIIETPVVLNFGFLSPNGAGRSWVLYYPQVINVSHNLRRAHLCEFTLLFETKPSFVLQPVSRSIYFVRNGCGLFGTKHIFTPHRMILGQYVIRVVTSGPDFVRTIDVGPIHLKSHP